MNHAETEKESADGMPQANAAPRDTCDIDSLDRTSTTRKRRHDQVVTTDNPLLNKRQATPQAKAFLQGMRAASQTQVRLDGFLQPVQPTLLSEFPKDGILERHWVIFNHIIVWINYYLLERKFHKRGAGLYIWSYGKNLGKTLLCNVLEKIVSCYWWVFEDEGWQQQWNDGKTYKCIIYNALNQNLLPFRQIELHGDRQEIGVRKRNNNNLSVVRPCTPFIITSNKPPEDLGYDQHGQDIDVWTNRMLILDVGDCELFPLIDRILEERNIAMVKEPAPPAFQFWRI